MELGLKNKNVLITGASKNIGKAIAISLAKKNSNVIICARNNTELKKVLKIMNKYNGSHHAFALDLEDPRGPLRLIENLKDNKIAPDIIVHNLGGSRQVTDTNFSRQDLLNVWQLNLGIAHEINKELSPQMIDKNWGRIIHISSLAAKTAKGYIPYVSAKSALEGYVRSMSKQLSPKNVIMNAIAPGLVDLPGRYYTSMKTKNPQMLEKFYDEHLPIRRMLKPNEIADLICYLCSHDVSYMAGAIIPIDGGGS
tara:strand:+ start:66 stop:824 length:759 start_codon:yes stop_codon:yes gene_type:complete